MNGDKCNVCLQPSTIYKETEDTPIECNACGQAWQPREMFTTVQCGHFLCIGCMTQIAREALGDRTKITDRGLPCPGFNCKSRFGVATVRKLALLGSKILPNERAVSGNPPVPIIALSDSNIAMIERFMEEAAIPQKIKFIVL
jgi:hypothetical protein